MIDLSAYGGGKPATKPDGSPDWTDLISIGKLIDAEKNGENTAGDGVEDYYNFYSYDYGSEETTDEKEELVASPRSFSEIPPR